MSTEAALAVARSAGVVGGATLASRALGLLRDIVFANLFLPGATDAFFIAFMIPNLFRRLVGEGSLTVAFVPVFTDLLGRSRDAAQRFFRSAWTLGALVGLAITALGIAAADPLIDAFAPGFALEPGKHALAVTLLRWCFPYILFLILVAVAMGTLNSLGHFFTPAIAPVLLNVSLIAGAFYGWLWLGIPILAVGAAVVVAGLLQLAIQTRPLASRGFAPRFSRELVTPETRRLGALMLPAVLGASVLQLNLLVLRFLSSFLGDGAVSYLYYADRLLELPLGVFVFSLGTASLPAFSRMVRDGDRAGLRDGFRSTLRLAAALALPSTLGLVLLREEIFRELFAWDPAVFGPAAVAGCAGALLYYAIGLVPITAARIYVGYSIAHENTRIPAWGAVVGVATNALVALALIGPLPVGALPDRLTAWQHAIVVADLGYAGLALASSIASTAHAVYLAAALRVRYGAIYRRADLLHGLRLVVAGAVMAVAVWAARAAWPWPEWGLLGLMAIVVLGVALYLAALRLLRSPELDGLLAPLRRGGPAEGA